MCIIECIKRCGLMQKPPRPLWPWLSSTERCHTPQRGKPRPQGFLLSGHALDDMWHADTSAHGTMRVDGFWRNRIARLVWDATPHKDSEGWRLSFDQLRCTDAVAPGANDAKLTQL